MSNDPIIVGFDGSDRGRDALALAGILARQRGAKLLVTQVFHLWPSSDPLPDEYTADLRRAAEDQVAQIPAGLLDGADAEGRAVPGSSAAHGLHDLADAEHSQLVVLGSTHQGPLGRVLPGAVADRFLHGAPCPVAIAPAGYADSRPERLRLIAVAFDGSPESRAAAQAGAKWALATQAQLRIVAIVEPEAYAVFGTGPMVMDDLVDSRRDQLQGDIDGLTAELPPELDVDVRLVHGVPAEKLLAEAAQGVDLLVMGSRAYGPVRRVLLGSVSDQVVRHAPCPVIVVPRAAAPAEEQHETATHASARP